MLGCAQCFLPDHRRVARGRANDGRRNGICDRIEPCCLDLFDWAAHADRIDFRRGGERADRDWNVIRPCARVDDIGEQKSAPLILPQSALELPAHQRVQLGILIDRAIDPDQQPALFERGKVRLKIERWAYLRFVITAALWIEHHARQRTI